MPLDERERGIDRGIGGYAGAPRSRHLEQREKPESGIVCAAKHVKGVGLTAPPRVHQCGGRRSFVTFGHIGDPRDRQVLRARPGPRRARLQSKKPTLVDLVLVT